MLAREENRAVGWIREQLPFTRYDAHELISPDWQFGSKFISLIYTTNNTKFLRAIISDYKMSAQCWFNFKFGKGVCCVMLSFCSLFAHSSSEVVF
jgi:hypothetical protein